MESMRSEAACICALLLAAAALGGGEAQQIDCTSQLGPVAPCLEFVQGTGKTPSADCCSGLTSLVKSSPVCLCQLAEGRLNLSALGVTVDLQRANSLPTACKLKGVDRSRCTALLGSPAPAPHAGPPMASGSETGTRGGSSSTAGGAAPSGSATVLVAPSIIAVAAAAALLWKSVL